MVIRLAFILFLAWPAFGQFKAFYANDQAFLGNAVAKAAGGGGVGGPGYTLTNTPGTGAHLFYFNADDITTSGSAPYATWPDRGTNQLTAQNMQSAATSPSSVVDPVLNTNVAYFNPNSGARQYVTNRTGFKFPTDFEIWALCCVTNRAGQGRWITSDTAFWAIGYNTTQKGYGYGWDSTSYYVGTGSLITNRWADVCYRFKGSDQSITVYTNGVLCDSLAGNGAPTTWWTNLWLGTAGAFNAEGIQGYVREIVGYPQLSSATGISNIHRYFTNLHNYTP